MVDTRLDMWRGRWEQNNIPWHEQDYNENLLRYWSTVSGGRKNLRVLVPLCGKSRDLEWLYSQGHTVVGVEGVRQAVEQLFTNMDLEYDVRRVEEHPNGWSYQSRDKRFTVYVADFLAVQRSVLGTFDVAFDRGSLEALEYRDREPYVEKIISLLEDDFSYHLSGFSYDPSLRDGPPRPLPIETVQHLFKGYKVNLLGCTEDSTIMGGKPVNNVTLNTYHIFKE